MRVNIAHAGHFRINDAVCTHTVMLINVTGAAASSKFIVSVQIDTAHRGRPA
jgi:hypothetical protein